MCILICFSIKIIEANVYKQKVCLLILLDLTFSFAYIFPDFLTRRLKKKNYFKNHSVQFSHSVMSNSFRPHGLQHTMLPCPSPSPGAYPNSSALSRGCHPTISSSVVPFFSCLQSSPASGSFPMSQFFASGGQSIGVSASA